MRGDYSMPGAGLSESDAHPDPMQQFDIWCTLHHHTVLPLFILYKLETTLSQSAQSPIFLLHGHIHYQLSEKA